MTSQIRAALALSKTAVQGHWHLFLGVGVVLVWATQGVCTQARTVARFWGTKVDSAVFESTARGPAEFIVWMQQQADLSGISPVASKDERGRFVFETLRGTATRTQAPLVAQLDQHGVPHRSFWVANMLRVTGDQAVVEMLARRDDVARLVEDAPLGRAELLESPRPEVFRPQITGVEWHVAIVGTPAVWAQGVRGAGAVVGSMDTGFVWTHPALLRQYRGWDRGIVSHDYNWHDAIHWGSGPCGPDSPEPCDADGHGTLTMGIAVGDDGAGNQIGIAPEARWIGCRCWEPVRRTYVTYVSECFQWFVAPTDLNDANPDPSRAPHVLYNSWICEFNEGCMDALVLQQIVENVRAAGIVVVASAGNSGPDCGTIDNPPAIYEHALTVGATTIQDEMANFSSRGPVLRDGSQRTKPDIVAPGQNLRTSDMGGGYTAAFSGTSFSGPLVAGVVALLVSAVPTLAGDVDALERIVKQSAEAFPLDEACGSMPPSVLPNNVYGHGRVNALASYERALAQTGIDDPLVGDDPFDDAVDNVPAAFRIRAALPNPFNPSVRLEYELPARLPVRLRVHDAAGHLVRELVAAAMLTAGLHQATWDGHDEHGLEVPSGTYFVRLEAGQRWSDTHRVTLVR